MGTKFHGIKTAAEYRRGELTKDLLKLIGAGVVVAGAIVAPNAVQLVDYFQPKNPKERNRIWKAIKYLEEKRKVVFEERGGRTYIILTDLGRVHLNEDSIWDLTIERPRRWDRKWRIVMFDLPTQNDRVRKVFRNKLEDFGLRRYQNSVFIYPHECYKQVFAVAKWYGIDRHVRYLVAEEVLDARRFLKEFDLP